MAEIAANSNGSASKLRKFDRTDSELLVNSEEMAGLTSDQLTSQSPQINDDNNDDDDDDDYSDYGELPPPPDGGYGWVVCFASFMCNMVVDGIAYTFGIFLGQFVEYFGEGKGKVAWVGSLLSGVYLSAGPIVSALANKYGCRAVCIAGSIVGCTAFALSTLSTSVNMLMLTYGVIGGFGFGMIYLPAVVAVGYYFETKRSLATGIAVCGSGFGTFAFAPLASFLLQKVGWKYSLLIFACMILGCAIFGAMMRPLTYPKKPKQKSLMQRIYEEKQLQLERGSFAGSFMVQLPDGTMERKLKMPLNTEPGVHSSVNLELLAQQVSGIGLQPVPTLPTITEAKVSELNNEDANKTTPSLPQSPPSSIYNGQLEMKSKQQQRIHRNSVTGSSPYATTIDIMTRNASQPAFGMDYHGLPKNGSVPSFQQQRSRKTSASEKFQPSLAAIKAASRADLDTESGMIVNSSKLSLSQRHTDSGRMVRPMSRKDIFYSGSVTNLPLYQSQKSLTNYRQSVLSLTKYEKAMASAHRLDPLIEAERNREQYDLCPCFNIPDSVKSVINNMLDVTLLKDPVFMLIGLSNIFGMAGLYVPFVYLVDAAQMAGIDNDSASFLLSIIGITNTIGRVMCGYVADFPAVNSLFLNNMCLLVCTIAVALTPLCQSYTAFIIMSVIFGAAVSGYISLTSIILVDLLGLDKLTNAFGLLILFRGFAAIIGSPLAGAVYDATQSYDLPFYMAGGLFAVSTVTSFMAPCLKRCTKSEETPIHIEALTPINEEPAEDMEDEEEDDQPITIIPKIIKTLPSPQREENIEPKYPQIGDKKTSTGTGTTTKHNESKL